MDIKPSELFKPTRKIIKPYDCSLVANEGPNMVGKFQMGNLEIPYDSQFTSVMTLQPEDKDMPIMYGFLGTNITFLAIKVQYLSNEQISTNKSLIDNKYLEYYYEDDPLVRRSMADLMILSGTKDNRIPQIYLYNPTEYVAQVYIMCANLDVNEISKSLRKDTDTIRGLYYNSILTDIVEYIIGVSGSTQLEIFDFNDKLISTIPLIEINVVKVVDNTITITTNHNSIINLEFNSNYNAVQAHSRINWVLNNYSSKYLTKEYPLADTRSPIINWYSNYTTTFVGLNLTKTQLQEIFINTINDEFDGEISKYDAEVKIRKIGSVREFEIVNEVGNYEIQFKIKDIAGNETIAVKNISMYESAPQIQFKQTSIDNNMFINDTWYYKVNSNIISANDIKNYYIESVSDYVDDLTIDDIIVNITFTGSGSTDGITASGITKVGYYDIEFILINGVGFSTSEHKLLFIKTNQYLEPIIDFKYDYNNSLILVQSGLTEIEFINLVVDSINNISYDNTVTNDDIQIDGDIVFPTTYLNTNYTAIFRLKNYSGVENIHQLDRIKSVSVTPVILSNPVYNWTSWNSNTNLMNLSSLTQSYLIDFMIESIQDLNDGFISKSNVLLSINEISGSTFIPINIIETDGTYQLEFTVENSQGRYTIESRILIVNSNIYGGNINNGYDFTIYGGNAFTI
jgi:hypothetical protein